MLSKTFLWPVLAGAALFAILVWWRGFFPKHAFIVSLAAAALVYWTLRTAEKFKGIEPPSEPGDD